MVALLLPHLPKSICQIPSPNLLRILELQELIPTMSSHIHQNITPRIGSQSLTARYILVQSVGQKPEEVLDGHLIAPVIDFDIVSVKVNGAVCVTVNGAGEGVPGIAGHVIG